MSFLIGLLTFVLVLVCLALILLVLIQLPKKEAGAGLAFGGGATDALFGAGTGNVLTKATKYAAASFFILAIIIGMLQSRFSNRSTNALISGAANKAAEEPAFPFEQPAGTTPLVAPIEPAPGLESTEPVPETAPAPEASTPAATPPPAEEPAPATP